MEGNDALIYGFIEFSNATGTAGPRSIMRPIILKSISTIGHLSFSVEDLQEAILTDFSKRLDILLLKAELGRLTGEQLLKYDTKFRKYTVYKEIVDYAGEYGKAKEQNDYFVKSLKQFIEEKTDQYSSLKYSEVFKYLVTYIEHNFSELIAMLAKGGVVDSRAANRQPGVHEFIEAYIYSKVVFDIALLNAFENIFNGIVLLYVYQHCPDVFSKENPFGSKVLYLDTNIVLRILGLQDSLNSTIGQEFLKYVSIPQFTCYISKDTWLELCGLIYNYSSCYFKINPNGNVNHVYQVMRKIGVNPHAIGDYIDELKGKLETNRIVIEREIELDGGDYVEFEQHVEKLVQKKYEHRAELEDIEVYVTEESTEKFRRQALHDLRNIYNIMYLRKKRGMVARDFESESYYFVTGDYVLRKYSNSEFKRRGEPYAIGDSTLAFLLYYRDPMNSKGFSVMSFINAQFNSRNLSIKNWIEYYSAVKQRKETGAINDTQAGYLLSKVILRNDVFNEYGVDDIIDSSLKEFEAFETEAKGQKADRSRLIAENRKISEDMLGIQETVNNLQDQLASVKISAEEAKTEGKELRVDLDLTKGQLRSQKIKTYIISAVLFSIGIVLLFSNTTILGTILSLLSIVMFLSDVLKRVRK